MTTSPKMPFLAEILDGQPIPEDKLAFFQERLRNRIYDFVLRKFVEEEKASGLTRAELARRLGKRPEIITRLLGAPGNWTLDTVSNLLLAIGAEELVLQSKSLRDRRPRPAASSQPRISLTLPKTGSGPLPAEAQTSNSNAFHLSLQRAA